MITYINFSPIMISKYSHYHLENRLIVSNFIIFPFSIITNGITKGKPLWRKPFLKNINNKK